MKITIAMDSLKRSLSLLEAVHAAERGIKNGVFQCGYFCPRSFRRRTVQARVCTMGGKYHIFFPSIIFAFASTAAPALIVIA